ncbi:CWF19-like protein 1 [Odontomachus brunneus]|uniref:CWF19-like protein 1 n=1 Tax=Odontomachus brunneus TaxID=486640 RepID=UPI0013F1DFD6|nr:CWF19-like protein 1 [Odontomachus brunneus]XP_032680223.1 CWF19-like protein 1 [Odontomachus brunneus]
MSDKQKVLICGDVEGNFNFLFSKVDAINKKSGPFDFLLCVGNFFGKDNTELKPYISGEKTISVSTYIVGPNRESDLKHYSDGDGYEICQNLTYLGKRGLYTASSGLKIAYLSGIEKIADDNKSVSFNELDVICIKNSCLKGQPSFRGVDILLTSPWPDGIINFDPNNPKYKYQGSKLIAWLTTHIKPRYHVSALEGTYYERPPYRNQSQGEGNIEIATRFIALAPVMNVNKKKWLYALNLTPVDRTRLSDLVMKTTDETPSPFPRSMLSDHPTSQKQSHMQFFYDMDSKESGKMSRHQNDGSIKRPKLEFDQSKCWFCLSSPVVSKHLVISVGTEIYLALAKGGLVEDHLLILPITHHQSLSILPKNVKDEMDLYKKAVTKYYESTDRVPVFFERNFKTSHCQLQTVPVHKNQAPALKEMFEELAECNNFKISELPSHTDLQQIAKPGVLYFYAELPSGEILYYRIKKDFPLQFGREVLASDRILDINDRSDWKDCHMSQDEEIEVAKKIRKQFIPFDIDI